jgi:hypothetical protein
MISPPSNPTALRLFHSMTVVMSSLVLSRRYDGSVLLCEALQTLASGSDWPTIASRWFSWQRPAVDAICDVVVDSVALDDCITRAFSLLSSTTASKKRSHDRMDTEGKDDPAEREEKGFVAVVLTLVCLIDL